MDTDPWMRVKPSCSAVFMMLLTFYAVCGLAFVAWLSIDRELKPNTGSSYRSTVRFMMNRLDIDPSLVEMNTHSWI